MHTVFSEGTHGSNRPNYGSASRSKLPVCASWSLNNCARVIKHTELYIYIKYIQCFCTDYDRNCVSYLDLIQVGFLLLRASRLCLKPDVKAHGAVRVTIPKR